MQLFVRCCKRTLLRPCVYHRLSVRASPIPFLPLLLRGIGGSWGRKEGTAKAREGGRSKGGSQIRLRLLPMPPSPLFGPRWTSEYCAGAGRGREQHPKTAAAATTTSSSRSRAKASSVRIHRRKKKSGRIWKEIPILAPLPFSSPMTDGGGGSGNNQQLPPSLPPFGISSSERFYALSTRTLGGRLNGSRAGGRLLNCDPSTHFGHACVRCLGNGFNSL